MSDHLAENIDEWPLNPFDVLGISRNAARPDVRRAYAALLRRFRPETHPRQFQRIRESFEAVLASIESRVSDESPHTVELRIDLSEHQTVPATKDVFENVAKPVASEIQLQQTADAERLWDEFSRQPDQTQLRQVTALFQSIAPTATVLLIGYWMQRLRPEFAPTEKPASWLIRGIKQHPLDSRFVGLLLDEFRREPDLTSVEFSGTVAAAIRNAELLSVYLNGRWSVMGELRRWGQLTLEIQQTHEIHPQFAFDYPEAWFRLMMLAFRFSVFYDGVAGKTLLLTAQKEIASASSRQLDHAADFDYMDLLFMARENRHLTLDSDALDELIDECLILSRMDLRRRAFAFVTEWIDTSCRGLDALTQLAIERPDAFEMLRKQLHDLHVLDAAPFSGDDELSAAVRDLVLQAITNGYEYSRYAITEFCHQECLTATDLFCQLDALKDTEPFAAVFSDRLRQDAAQILTCQLIGSFLKSCSPSQRPS